jgi:hypothetical protein
MIAAGITTVEANLSLTLCSAARELAPPHLAYMAILGE